MGKAKLRLFIYNHASSCECVDDVNTFIETLLLYAIFIIRYIELLLTHIKGGAMYTEYYVLIYKNDANLFSMMDFGYLLHVFALETNLE